MLCAILVIAALVAGGCTHGSRAVKPRLILRSKEYLFDVAWASKARVVVSVLEDPGPSFQLRQFRDDGTKYRSIGSTAPGCPSAQYRDPQRLPDGRLSAERVCNAPTVPGATVDTLVALDRSGSEQLLAPLTPTQPPGIPGTDAGSTTKVGDRFAIVDPFAATGTHTAWNPTVSEGITVVGNDCHTLARINSAGYTLLHATVPTGGTTWDLADVGQPLVGGGCWTHSQADWPTANPDFSQVAFFALPPYTGNFAAKRGDIMLLDPNTRRITPLLTGVTAPASLRWSPDGRFIGFEGDPRGRGGGLWLFDPKHKTLRRVLEGEIGAWDWSPTGRQIIRVDNIPDATSEPFVYVLDIP